MGICTSKVSSHDNPIESITLRGPSVAPDVIVANINKYYTFIKLIGNGHYGIVREARKIHSQTKVHFAIKSVPKQDLTSTIEVMKRELSILRVVDHPNIIKMYEVYEDEKYLHLVMELCKGGDLLDVIISMMRLNEFKAAKYMYKLFSAVNYLHKIEIVHRDIKPENILLSGDSQDSEIKIVDFGLSFETQGMSQMKSIVGTPFYVAPEVLSGEYNFAWDAWSLGVLMHVMLVGYPPFFADTTKEIFNAIKKNDVVLVEEDWAGISKIAQDLVTQLLEKNPKLRITCAEALKHDWFKILKMIKKKKKPPMQQTLEKLRRYKAPKRMKKEALKVCIKYITAEYIDDLTQVFETIDTEHTGFVQPRDLERAFRQLGFEQAGDDILRLCEQITHVDEGKIQYSDFLIATVNFKQNLSEQMLFDTFKHFDKENKGYISQQNLQKALEQSGTPVTEEEIEKILSELDIKKPGRLDFDEFMQMMLMDNSPLKTPYPRGLDTFSSSVINLVSIETNN